MVFSLVVQPSLKSSADSCTVSNILVNSCRPWLGGYANNYPQVGSDTESQMLYQEQRIGRQVDIVHTYHPVGSNTLSAADIYFATRANTMLYTNWKPTSDWATISSDNAAIDEMAASIKSISPVKIFLTLHHEPENDVSPGGDPNCPGTTFKGTFGTVTDYRNMWAYVENRFAQDGVTNVVWAIDYMNYPPWNCVVPDLYPGDQYIDWIVFNAYDNDSAQSFDDNVSNLYSLLTADSNGAHDFLSKPWGIVEWGITGTSTANEEAFYSQAKTALDYNTFPNLKMYMIYDSLNEGESGGTNYRVGYDDTGSQDTTKGDYYNAFADDPRFTDAYYSATSPISPPPSSSSSTSSTDGAATNNNTTTNAKNSPAQSSEVKTQTPTSNTPAPSSITNSSQSNKEKTSPITLAVALRNNISTHRVTYITGSSVALIVILTSLWFARRRFSYWLMSKKHFQRLSRLANLLSFGRFGRK